MRNKHKADSDIERLIELIYEELSLTLNQNIFSRSGSQIIFPEAVDISCEIACAKDYDIEQRPKYFDKEVSVSLVLSEKILTKTLNPTHFFSLYY